MVINVKKICAICVTYSFCVRLDRASPPRAKQAENLQDFQDFAMREARAGVLDRVSGNTIHRAKLPIPYTNLLD